MATVFLVENADGEREVFQPSGTAHNHYTKVKDQPEWISHYVHVPGGRLVPVTRPGKGRKYRNG